MYSGGGGSWAATMRTIAEHGTADVALLFTDVKGAESLSLIHI